MGYSINPTGRHPGLEVHIMAKKNATVGTMLDGGVLTLTVTGFPPIVVDSEKLHPNIQLGAMMRGLKQRLENAAALERNRETGRSATPEEKYNAIRELANWVTQGDQWEAPRATGRGRVFNVGAVVMGMMRAARIDLDTANARIDGLAAKRDITREEAAKVWAATKDVAIAMAEIRAESAPEGADDLLAELEGE
jgi:hypothetical protein